MLNVFKWLIDFFIGLFIGLTTGNWEYFNENVVEPFVEALEEFANALVRLAKSIVEYVFQQAFAPLIQRLTDWAQGFGQALSEAIKTGFAPQAVSDLAKRVELFLLLLAAAYIVVWTVVWALSWYSSVISSFTDQIVFVLVPVIMTLIVGALVVTIAVAAWVSAILSGDSSVAQQTIVDVLKTSLASESIILAAPLLLLTAFGLGTLFDRGMGKYFPVRYAMRFAFSVIILVLATFTVHKVAPALFSVGLSAYNALKALRPGGFWGLPETWWDKVGLALTLLSLGVAIVKLGIAVSEDAPL